MDGQLRVIVELLGECDSIGAQLETLKEKEKLLLQRRVAFNPHCSVAAQDIASQFKELVAILNYKKPLLEQEIEFQKTRGITLEQFQEIETMFKHYDTDGSQAIDLLELRACLFALGEESTKAAVEQYLKEFGNGRTINAAGFKNLMTNLIGVSHTKEQIVEAFEQISRGEPLVDQQMLDKFFTPLEVQLFSATARKDASSRGFNFRDWTEGVFAR